MQEKRINESKRGQKEVWIAKKGEVGTVRVNLVS